MFSPERIHPAVERAAVDELGFVAAEECDQRGDLLLAPPRIVGFRAGVRWRSEASPLAGLGDASASRGENPNH
jgi:hypothetical protein